MVVTLAGEVSGTLTAEHLLLNVRTDGHHHCLLFGHLASLCKTLNTSSLRELNFSLKINVLS